MDERRNQADAPDADEERLYDAYLDAALGGGLPDPAKFLASHEGASPALKERLDALHQAAERGRSVRAAQSGMLPSVESRPAEKGLPFAQLGEFRLLRRLDEGGMGAIYLAEQGSLGRVVALKVLRPELRGSPTADARLEREAIAVARLDHPHIVQVHAVGEDGGVRYVAMAYVEGQGLDEILDAALAAGRRVPTPDVLRWGAQIARALECAHAASIVHRDVKPSNIRITPDGRAMLLDFGIARALDAPALTMTGPFVGTPLYAAPEQLGGTASEVDGRADVYGLGVTLYEALSGRPPFAGRTAEQVLHNVLAGDPPPLRRLAPAISRDLDVVIRKAMARDPAQRYAGAAELAADLEALMEFRPIQARPPGPATRTLNWARRNPGLAAMAATGTVALIAGAAFLVVQARAADEQRRADARHAVDEANARLAAWRHDREESAALEQEVAKLSDLLWSQYLTDERIERLNQEETAAAALRRRREQSYYEVLDLLRRAESLDPEVTGVAATQAALYLERWREAVAARDREAGAFYRDLVLGIEPDGAASRELRGAATVSLHVDPPGAETFLFRYRELRDIVPGGEPRVVPVPVQDAPPLVAPGTQVLVVVSDNGPVRRGDLVVEIDGKPVAGLSALDAVEMAQRGVPALVHHDGALVRVELPAGVELRATAAPLAISPRCRVELAPPAILTLEPGEYLVLARAPHCEDQRIVMTLNAEGRHDFDCRLLPEGTTPAGFVHISGRPAEPTFWMQEREVTAGEYLLFLNDPETLAAIDRGGAPRYFPRDSTTEHEGGFWKRGSDGRYGFGEETVADHPVAGVSRDDARAYVRWYGKRIGAGARGLSVRLPTQRDWTSAGGSSLLRLFPFGNAFRPRWAKSCFSREKPGFEPVLAYVIDESPYGVHDLAGGVCEWTDDEDRKLGHLCGGSWALAAPVNFQNWYSVFIAPDKGSWMSGFRLLIETKDAAK